MIDSNTKINESDREAEGPSSDPFLTSGIGSRITDSAKHVGGTRRLAELIGMSEAQLYRITSDKSQAKIETVTAIAKACGVSIEWLATGEGPMRLPDWRRESEEEMVSDVLLGDEEAAKSRQERFRSTMDLVKAAKDEGRQAALDDFAVVPVYDVRASAGYGAAIDSEKVVSQIAFRRDWLTSEGLHINGLAAVTADGDSMEPTIADGSLLLVDTQQREVAGAHIYVLRLDGHIYAKRLQRLYDGSVRVSSDNKAYADEVVDRGDATRLDILGRVVWIGRRA